ncbi:S8 family peptidase [Streptomyces sp. NPDC060223]|uniref:S8 family peptidase n=1 Tax=unclassified Streptomyces TaxID=2593676 RepID=UPI0036304D1A
MVAPLAAVVLAAGLLTGTAGGAQALPEAAGPGHDSPAVDGGAKTVTLVTGDRVTLDATGKVTRVTAAEGREGTAFRVEQAGGHAYVVPRDADALIANGTADRRLFDVTELVASRYDDAARADLPLIVTYDKGKSLTASTFSASGATVRRDLPSVNGDALRARKSRGAALWQTLTGSGAARGSAAAASSAKVASIRLDGRVEAALDRSVAQIGAPEAWQAGYDGKGVKVAVLDTGVDATHPDLTDRIDAQKNFSDATDTVDRVGHGTHVASTIAGSGAKSGGTYKGVAPGARLLVGKVLDDSGSGYESGIVAGMQWAVAEGAKVVNLSLGGPDTAGIDTLEQAVNDLSAGSGTLFVIAAGNDGPDEGTIGSPGSAAAALTVGAVDREDATADFSSRGPTADGSLKPDITAPGVDIVAAHAAQGTDGDPAADGYVSMSGTSMATPHVSGAAAILAQEHPDWTGEQIKAALTASAKPLAGVSAYTQGTGRTDVAKAITQQLTSSPTSLGFGTQQYPHTDDRPVSKEVSYRNVSDRPLTLDLATEAYGVDGKPAADGTFEVSPKRLTVPAGGKASATVTADSSAGTIDGTFAGAVTATSVSPADGTTTADGKANAEGAPTTARTAIGINREVESYNLTIKHLDLKGKATGDSETGIYGLDNTVWQDVSDRTDGQVTVRLPKGRYSLDGRIVTGGDGYAVLLNPKFTLAKDTTLVMDARKAKPVRITVPDAAAKNTDAMVTFHNSVNADNSYATTYLADSFKDLRFGQFGARVPAGEALAQYTGTWKHGSVNYRPAWNRTGDLAGFTQNIRRSQLAKVNVVIGAPANGKTASVVAAPLLPTGSWFDLSPGEGGRLPLTGTEYVLPNGVKWHYSVSQSGAPGADGEPVYESSQSASPKAYAAGREYTERFNIGVFGPSLPAGTLTPGYESPGALRSGDEFAAYLPLFSDGAGHLGESAYTKATSGLYADGTKVFAESSPLNGDVHTLPAGKHTYRLTTDVSRATAQSAVSSRVTAAWTFASSHVAGDTAVRLPLSVVRFTPKLSTASTAKAGASFAVPFRIEGAAKASTVRKLAFKVSYDNGRTWKTAKAVDGKLLKLRHPAKAGTVSLRATLTDADGNTLEQTVYRAYRTTK